jgi:hypothetical protein
MRPTNNVSEHQDAWASVAGSVAEVDEAAQSLPDLSLATTFDAGLVWGVDEATTFSGQVDVGSSSTFCD